MVSKLVVEPSPPQSSNVLVFNSTFTLEPVTRPPPVEVPKPDRLTVREVVPLLLLKAILLLAAPVIVKLLLPLPAID